MVSLHNWNNKALGGKKEKVIRGETEELGADHTGPKASLHLSLGSHFPSSQAFPSLRILILVGEHVFQ